MKCLAPCLLAAGLALLPAALRADDEKQPPKPGSEGQDAAALFDRLDANKDGQLTKDEVPEEHQRLFGRLLKTADKDGDGQIDRDEFAAGLADSRPPRGEDQPDGGKPGKPGAGFNPEALFKQLDVNGDGKVTLDEVPEERRERFKRGIGKADKDGDGAVTIEEFRAGMRALTGRPEQPQPGGDKVKQPDDVAMRILAVLDLNKDGTLSSEEIAGAAKSLSTLDANGDGSITRDELQAAPAQPAKPGKPGQPGAGAQAFADEFLRRLKEADKDGDGQLSREEAPDRLKERFDEVDTNKDGFIDQSEIKQMLAAFAARPRLEGEGDLLERLKLADKDGDGKLSRDEAPGPLKEHFDEIDANQDGFIDTEELRESVAKFLQQFSGEAILRRFKEADKDGDGKLSRDEAPEQLRRNFDRVDTNKDELIDQEEFQVLFPGRPGKPEGGQPKPEKPEQPKPDKTE